MRDGEHSRQMRGRKEGRTKERRRRAKGRDASERHRTTAARDDEPAPLAASDASKTFSQRMILMSPGEDSQPYAGIAFAFAFKRVADASLLSEKIEMGTSYG
jgi:hypothetical protein